MIVEIDGNDGVGKSFLIKKLTTLYNAELADFTFKDRGGLTLATDNDTFVKEDGVIYILLDCSEKVSQQRILKRGDSIEEKYHTLEDLNHYRNRFKELSVKYGIPIYSTECDVNMELLNKIFNYIKGFKDGYSNRNK